MSEELKEGHEEIDELGNRWVYNPETGFLEHEAFNSITKTSYCNTSKIIVD